MRFYRVSYSTEGGSCAGYNWFRTRREAEASARETHNANPEEYALDPTDERVQAIDITPTKAGILDALRRFAEHPDNG